MIDVLANGTLIADRFEIERPHAAGSFGAIYQARDRVSGNRVALKVMLRETDASRFERESRVLSEIHDPGVVTYIDHGVDKEGQPYLVMQWLDGEDLDQRLTRGPLTVEETLALGVRIAHGLGAAHARGVIHRDVKPTNIFLVNGNAAEGVLLDFGIARSRAERIQTGIGIVVGTPGYLAPEQARADAQIDARADVFALACVLWESVVGRPAFDGATVMSILTKVLFEPVERLDHVVPGTPRELGELVERALSKDPGERPRDGSDFAIALTALSAHSAAPLGPRSAITDVERTLATVIVAKDHDPQPGTMATWPALAANDAARLETLADGSVAALVRGQTVATDQATSAARLALLIKSARPSLAVGVATGRGVVGMQLSIGEVITRAAALVAQSPGILVDATTAGLLADRFRMRLDARGAELLAEDPSGARSRRVFGRERELELAESLFRDVVDEGAPATLVITSAPGLGKTTLAREIVARIAASDAVPSVWQAAGEELRKDEPWSFLGRLLRSAGDAGETDPARAGVALERWSSARLGENDPGVELVLSLAGLPRRSSSPFVRAAHDSQGVFTVHAHEMLVRLFRAETARNPLLLILEDVHHADVASFDALAEVIGGDAPMRLLTVVTSRTDDGSEARVEGMARGPRVTRVTLGGLGRRAAEQLVREGLENHGDDLEARVADLCLRGDGNPFLLGELVRAERAGVRGLPGTVGAVLQSRFDALPGLSRRVLRAASVLGGGSAEDVLAVTGPLDIRTALDGLIQEGILVREPGSDHVAFRNPLLHEVAYGMLTAEDRALAHRLVAERLEASGRGSPVLIAGHWQRAEDPARAAAWLGQAARDALATDDVASAMRFAERGLPGSTGVLRGDLLATLAEARLWQLELKGAAEAASEALRLLPSGTRAWCRAAGASGVAEGRLGNADALEGLAADLVVVGGDTDPQGPSALATALARVSNHLFFLNRIDAANAVVAHLQGIANGDGLGDPLVEMRLAQALAIATRYRGDLRAHVEWAERALAKAQALGDRRTSVLLVTNLGDALLSVGRAAEAEPLLRTGIEAARSMGLSAIESPLRLNLANALSAQGRDAEALTEVERSLASAPASGDERVTQEVKLACARILFRTGAIDRASAMLAELTAGLGEVSPLEASSRALAAAIALARSEVPRAIEEAEIAARRVEASPPDISESVVWTVLAEARRAAGDEPGAGEAISIGWGRVFGSLTSRGHPAEETLENVPEVRHLHQLAIEVGVASPSESPVRDTLPP